MKYAITLLIVLAASLAMAEPSVTNGLVSVIDEDVSKPDKIIKEESKLFDSAKDIPMEARVRFRYISEPTKFCRMLAHSLKMDYSRKKKSLTQTDVDKAMKKSANTGDKDKLKIVPIGDHGLEDLKKEGFEPIPSEAP